MTIVRDVLSRKVPIIEQGKRKSILGLEGLLLQHLQSGLGGNLKAGAYLLNFALRILATEVEDIEEEDLSERDQEIMTNFIAQLTKKEKGIMAKRGPAEKKVSLARRLKWAISAV